MQHLQFTNVANMMCSHVCASVLCPWFVCASVLCPWFVCACVLCPWFVCASVICIVNSVFVIQTCVIVYDVYCGLERKCTFLIVLFVILHTFANITRTQQHLIQSDRPWRWWRVFMSVMFYRETEVQVYRPTTTNKSPV